MCILFWTVDNHPTYKFIFAGNRDEFLQRPTSRAQWWKAPHENVLAGTDLQLHDEHLENGTWLGITKEGRFSALTNYREQNFQGDISRGVLVRDFLYGKDMSVHDYFEHLEKIKHKFGGFSLINLDFGKPDGSIEMAYFTNREDQPITDLNPREIYGLSNSILTNPWLKVKEGKMLFEKIIQQYITEDELVKALLGLLGTTKPMNNENDILQIFADLKERIHVPLFKFPKSLGLKVSEYATRTSSIVLIDHENNVTFVEHAWYPTSNDTEHIDKDLIYHFKIKGT